MHLCFILAQVMLHTRMPPQAAHLAVGILRHHSKLPAAGRQLADSAAHGQNGTLLCRAGGGCVGKGEHRQAVARRVGLDLVPEQSTGAGVEASSCSQPDLLVITGQGLAQVAEQWPGEAAAGPLMANLTRQACIPVSNGCGVAERECHSHRDCFCSCGQ